MFSPTDTIVAIATPPGRGGIAVIRVSGPEAASIAGRMTTYGRPFEPRRATLTAVRSNGDPAQRLDQGLVTYFEKPASYTGEDVVEISLHGSPILQTLVVAEAVRAGARLAEPGEFTLRAYLNGRLDLAQAEAVADLVEAATPLQARVAFDQLQGTLTSVVSGIHDDLFDLIARLEASVDFPDEGYHFGDPRAMAKAVEDLIDRANRLVAEGRRGRLIREGLQVAIVGPPNAGKSSLFNALSGAARAIVTDIPGTTRDLVTEVIDLNGVRTTLVDTAGLRETIDTIEVEGVARAAGAAAVADLVLFVADGSHAWPERAYRDFVSRFTAGNGPSTLVIRNKSDLEQVWTRDGSVAVSAVTGAGLEDLRSRMVAALDVDRLVDPPAITNVRHIALVERGRDALARARDALAGEVTMSEEFVLADLQEARAALEEIAGRRTPDDLLAHIFSRFCIGK
jgi:tRNA modification GTPase